MNSRNRSSDRSKCRLVLGAMASCALVATLGIATLTAQTAPPATDRYSVPGTVSPEAAAQLNKLYARLARAPKRERPKTQEDWDRANVQLAAIAAPISTATADALHVIAWAACLCCGFARPTSNQAARPFCTCTEAPLPFFRPQPACRFQR